MRLLPLLSWPYARRHALRTVLTVVGVVLGITTFVGMYTANGHVLAAFSDTIDRIAGKAELQITAGDAGFGEEVLEQVQSVASVQVAVPVIEAVVHPELEGQGDLLVLAVDMTGDRSLRSYEFEGDEEGILDDPLVFLAQPDSVIVSRELVDRHGLGIGRRLVLNTAAGDRAFTIRGIMKPAGLASAFGGNLAVMDVYAAQKMFGRGRVFDRIDLALRPGSSREQAQRELGALLGPGFEIQPPSTRGQQAEAMVAGYRTMVNLSSVFALFIGMFIIHSSFVTAVAQRRTEIGILRALGATRTQVRNLYLVESLVIGAVGSVIGAVAGSFAARGIAALFARVVADLYGVAQQPPAGRLEPLVLVVAIAAGIGTSVLAAVLPARAATRVEPIDAIRKDGPHGAAGPRARARLLWSAALAATATLLLVLATAKPLVYAGYVLTLAAALIAGPVASHALMHAVRPLLVRWRPVEGALAGDSLVLAAGRTSGAVLALMFSLALVVAFAGMARASYGSILSWLETMMNPDLFVMPSPRLDLRTTRFPGEMGDELEHVPGVARVQRFRNNRITFRGAPAMVAAIEMSSVAVTSRQRPVAGDREEMYRAAASGRAVLVSDNLAQLRGLALGDVVEMGAPYGTVRLPIAGIIPDYTDQQGTIFIDRSLFLQYWRDAAVSDFRVFAAPGADLDAVRQRIIDRYAGTRQVFVLTHTEARAYVLGLAERWFGLVNVQIAIAVLVAMLGIVNALTVSITDRRRELGVLKAVGALRAQIRRTIWLEAATVALVGTILGTLLGAVTLRYLLDVVRRDALGLRLDYAFPVPTVALLVPVMILAAVVAAWWPSRLAVRGSVVEALEYE